MSELRRSSRVTDRCSGCLALTVLLLSAPKVHPTTQDTRGVITVQLRCGLRLDVNVGAPPGERGHKRRPIH
jgi:hypothetical protein